ncbi:hypothetical protein RR46_03250 [Papilio xuthus]|uniref:Uncharacterized protein n=1 Tax=Papilio xuthus TaxID=66420 RepID=A0A194QGU3_PAPXU|nr:hypothetical protein RR46_03250 [Papilio xuthus]
MSDAVRPVASHDAVSRQRIAGTPAVRQSLSVCELSACLLHNGCADRRHCGGSCYAERGDEYIDYGDEEDAEDCHVIDLVSFADLLLVFDVVPTVHDKANANSNL